MLQLESRYQTKITKNRQKRSNSTPRSKYQKWSNWRKIQTNKKVKLWTLNYWNKASNLKIIWISKLWRNCCWMSRLGRVILLLWSLFSSYFCPMVKKMCIIKLLLIGRLIWRIYWNYGKMGSIYCSCSLKINKTSRARAMSSSNCKKNKFHMKYYHALTS